MPATLYAAPLSLFSGKARAYFDWADVDYQEVLSTPDIYRDIIVPQVGRPVIPVVKTDDGQILQDTTLIIDHYDAALEAAPSIYPETPKQKLVALLLECFGDEWLVIPAMHYRWNYNEDWVYGEFGKVALPNGTAEEQHAAGKDRGSAFRGIVPALGVNDETIPAIEASYEQFLSDLDAHFALHPFLLGTRPSIGDFGLIGPLYAHLYRDPASGEIMKRLAPRVADWVQRMVNVQQPRSGEFLEHDEVPETLLPILRRMMREQIPHLADVAKMLGVWAEENQVAEPPRALGFAPFTVEGVTGQRMAMPFSLWMLQRATDFLHGLAPDDRASCDELLRAADGQNLMEFENRVRLQFSDHRLTIAGR